MYLPVFASRDAFNQHLILAGMLTHKAAFDLGIGCIVKRAYLDAYRTTVIVTEVGEAFCVIHT